MNAYRKKQAYQRQINTLQKKIQRISDDAERLQVERALRILGLAGGAFSVTEANALSVSGYIDVPQAINDRRIDKVLGWSNYHESATVRLASRNSKRPHFLSLRVDDGRYSFNLRLSRPHAGKLERELTEEEKNDTFFVRYLSRLCSKFKIRIEFQKFEDELERVQQKAAQMASNLDRLRQAAS